MMMRRLLSVLAIVALAAGYSPAALGDGPTAASLQAQFAAGPVIQVNATQAWVQAGFAPLSGATFTGQLVAPRFVSTGANAFYGTTSVLPQGLTAGQYGLSAGAPYSGAPVAGLGIYAPSGWSADLADFCPPGASGLTSCVRVDSGGDIYGAAFFLSNVSAVASTVSGRLAVVALDVAGGEAHYANGTYTDPQGGVARAVKISGNGLAVSGGENVIGGLTADGIVNNGPVTETATATPASAAAACATGARSHDANFVYLCVATNTWKRTALSSW